MTNTQVTLVQIDNYGPWTVTPEPRREADLQTLQSRLYADVSQFVGARDGYVFFTRFDNMIAVTNGLSMADHRVLQESVGNRYPVSLSLGVAADSEPVEALSTATSLLQDAGSAQDRERREILAGETAADTGDATGARNDGGSDDDDDVRIAHFDVNDATGEYTDELNAFDSFIEIEQAYAELMRYVRTAHGGLSFFVGGDNVIAVCPDLASDAYHDAIAHVEEEVGVALKVGVGSGENAHLAGMDAKHALEVCRADGSRVEFAH